MRTSIHFSLPDKNRNVICITGPSPSIGKSFIASNLGYLAAQSGSKILLIDADMRRGKIGQLFNIPQKTPGLSQLLSRQCSMEDAMHKVSLKTLKPLQPKKVILGEQPKKHGSQSADIIERRNSQLFTNQNSLLLEANRKEVALDYDDTVDIDLPLTDDEPAAHQNTLKPDSRQSHITIIPRGTSPDNPSELLMHSGFPELLETVSEHYDLIIIDTPPVLAATDAMIVSRYADYSLMVLRQWENTTEEAAEVVRTFNNNHLRLSGIVLNGYNSKRGKYGGYYGGYYGYQYRYTQS